MNNVAKFALGILALALILGGLFMICAHLFVVFQIPHLANPEEGAAGVAVFAAGVGAILIARRI